MFKIHFVYIFSPEVEKSECHASMVHKLLALYYQSQTQWTQRYPTTRHIPEVSTIAMYIYYKYTFKY